MKTITIEKKETKEKVKNDITEIVFILDKSGSMSGFEDDTIGGFNSTIERQKQEGGTALVSTVLFNTATQVLHDRVPLDKIEKMTRRDYYVGGCTALFDAVGGAIHHIGNIHKYAREEDVPEHTIFVITTDGMENASREYNYKSIKALIENQQKEYGWEFVFLGANIDSEDFAESIGINRKRSANYTQDEEGMKATYDTVCCAISAVRANHKLDDFDIWREAIDNDNKRRKK